MAMGKKFRADFRYFSYIVDYKEMIDRETNVYSLLKVSG